MTRSTGFRLLRSFYNDFTLVTGVGLGIVGIGIGGSVWQKGLILFFALWLIFGKRYVYWVKSRRRSLGKINHDLLLALFRGVITALVLFYFGWIWIIEPKTYYYYPVTDLVALLALSVIPVNMGIDRLERKWVK